MKNILKILVLIALVAVMITALAVSTSAYISWDEETGTFPGGSNSAYADINAPGWEQVAGVKSVDRDSDGAYTSEGDLTKGNGTFNAYFNESTGTVVVESVSGNSITGNYGENDKAEYFANWAQLNADKVTAIEMRNVTHLNNPGYVFFRLTKAKTFKVESQLDEWSGTQPGTGIFYELASLETLYWGDWNKENGEYTITRGEEGVIDLRGFEYFTPKTTTYNGTHTLLFFDAAVFKTSARKVILPAKQELSNPNLSYNVIAVSEGYIDCNPGTEQNPNSNYNKEIAAGKLCTVLKNKTTGETGYTTFWAISPEWTAVSIKAAEDRFGGEYSGIIPYKFAYGASKLEEVEIPASVTLRYIEADAFGWCTSLKLIRVKGAVSADLYIENANAFAGISDLTIEVYSKQDKANMEAALKKVGITNVTVVSTAPVEPESATKSAITAGGYSIRIDDTKAKNKGPALRAEFTLLGEIVDVVERRECLDLEDFGVIVFSEKTLETIYEGNVNAVLAAGFANENPKIAKASAAKGPYISIDKNTGDRTFAVAITDISADKSTARIYTYAYAEWSDGSITYTTYTSERTGKTAHSLYDATVFAFRSGIVNSQNFNTGVDLWDILSNGAFTVKAGEEKAFADGLNLDVQYTLDAENDFTYLNLDLHAWILYKDSSGNVPWDGGGHSLEADNSSTNIVWSLLCDGNDLVAVYRKDPEATGDAVLPRIIDHAQYTAAAPFSPNYFKPGTGWGTFKGTVDAATMKNGDGATNGLYKQAAIYSPILSDANASKITTLVIDYGVNKIAPQSLGNKTVSSLTTIVYPEGVSAEGYIFANNQSVATVICAPVSEHILPAATQEKDFGNVIDLSGLDSMSLQYAFSGVVMAENIILPINNTTSTRTMYTFNGCTNLKRVWTIGDEVPAEGTINLTGSSTLKSFCRRAFEGVPASTILMPATFEGVGYSSMIMEQQDDSIRVFGTDVAHTIVLVNHKGLTAKFVQWNEGGLIAYQDKLHSLDNDNVDKIRVTCPIDGVEMTKTIAEWKAYFEANPVQ